MFAHKPYIIIIGRLLTGFAMGMIYSVKNFICYKLLSLSLGVGTNSANVYMAEISSPKLRSSMMSIGSVMLSFGMYCNL